MGFMTDKLADECPKSTPPTDNFWPDCMVPPDGGSAGACAGFQHLSAQATQYREQFRTLAYAVSVAFYRLTDGTATTADMDCIRAAMEGFPIVAPPTIDD
jgi:hypothetical protein